MFKRYFVSIRNIPWTTSLIEFENYFSQFGVVKNAKVIFNKEGVSTGYGFVEYYDELTLQNVTKKTHILEDKVLTVSKGIEELLSVDLNNVKKYLPNNYSVNCD